MNRPSNKHAALLMGASLVFLLACNLAAPSNPPSNSPSPEPATAVVEETDTAQPEEPTTAPTALASATAGPQCTVLQTLNLRSGPGTAYDPPIGSFPASTVLMPTGYSAAGVPGGTWVQVEEQNTHQKGWVSAGSAFVSCNLDLATLPTVNVEAPPQPAKPKAKGSTGEGPCAEGGTDDQSGNHYDCKILLAGGFPIEAQYFKNGAEIGKSDIKSVLFRVLLNGNEIYRNNEKSPAYCLFGGDGPCNSWTFEDGVYKFESGGTVVEPGDYTVEIDPEMADPTIDLHWDNTFHVTLP